jgi:glycosyltransferase involved in cell wall biosynthesis
MNILLINTVDNVGGAARAMYRLHQGLQRLGHRSQLLVGHQTMLEPGIDYINRQAKPFRTLTDEVLDRVGAQLGKRWGVDNWSYRNSWHIPQASAFHQADVISLHNLHGGYFNFRALPELARHKPMVWTLHDMWALTGHCAYSYDCERWRTGCYDCPLLKESGQQIVEPAPVPVDRTRSVWKAKRRVYQITPLHIVTPSEWLRGLVQESILASAATIQCIPNGIDLDVFCPLDQGVARQALDLPVDTHVIFFSAHGVMHGRKGFSYLLQALGNLPDADSIWLLTSGGQTELGPQAERFSVRQLGQLSDERLQRLAFAAADLFVFPTLADNQPLVLLEALACGTPIISFDVGGVPQMARHMETGYLARYKDAGDLARGIQLLLNDDNLRTRMRHRCREIAESEYSLESQARRYLEVYKRATEHAHALSNPK